MPLQDSLELAHPQPSGTPPKLNEPHRPWNWWQDFDEGISRINVDHLSPFLLEEIQILDPK